MLPPTVPTFIVDHSEVSSEKRQPAPAAVVSEPASSTRAISGPQRHRSAANQGRSARAAAAR